jgi:hypothetical protein
MMALDETYVPFDQSAGRRPGEGRLRLRRHARWLLRPRRQVRGGRSPDRPRLGDAVVAANEYRNFQIRIV